MPALASKRPAEVSGLAGAVVLLIAWLAGVTDPALIVALGVVVGSIPAMVTWSVVLLRGRKGGA